MNGERFRAARARARMTLKDVAAICECSPQAVKKWEDGTACPSSSKIIAFCRATDVSLEWMMDGDPLDFHSTLTAPQGKHAKYWVREAIGELRGLGYLAAPPTDTDRA